MKELVPMNDYGIFVNEKYEAMADSRFVAFGKAIEDVLKHSGFSEEFKQHNFVPVEDHYVMTRDGVVALAMWCKVSDEAYIKRFDEVEEHIYYLQSLREMDTQLIEVIRSVHDEPHFYIRELDMLHKLVLGMTAKEYRKAHNISEEEVLSSYLTVEEFDLLSRLQLFDIGFVIAVPDFQQRKQMLEYQAMKWQEGN